MKVETATIVVVADSNNSKKLKKIVTIIYLKSNNLSLKALTPKLTIHKVNSFAYKTINSAFYCLIKS